MSGNENNKYVGAEQIQQVTDFLQNWQLQLCNQLAAFETSQDFVADDWEYATGGGGRSCVLAGGEVIEQAGVNFSCIEGLQLPAAATAKRPQLHQAPFKAIGTSVVVHPRNPFCPTSHANLRLLVAYPEVKVDKVAKNAANPEEREQLSQPVWWFGGGFDLTPYYGFEEDAVLWHQHAAQACQEYGGNERYAQFKKQCDDYFYLPHRQEHRGIGGIFFDDLHVEGFDACFNFIKRVAEHYALAYISLLTKRHQHVYNDQQRHFQCYRRGRYVEFNLLYDRGTRFGLQSAGRTESILMSLPPEVCWRYNYQPQVGTPEYDLYHHFLTPRDWLAQGGENGLPHLTLA